MPLEVLEERTLLSLTLVRDINRVPLYPAEITGAGGDVYFMTSTPGGASDLDVKTAEGLTVLTEFPASDNVISLAAAGTKLFVFVDDAQAKGQLWVADGTRTGTKLINVPGYLGAPDEAAAVGAECYFVSLIHGNLVLFESDGTAAGTVPVPIPKSAADLAANFNGSVASYHGALYFGFGDLLMRTDGTTTTVVGTFGQTGSDGVPTTFVDNLTVAGGLLDFTVEDASGAALYATDGTAGGTTLLHNFAFTNPSDPTNLTNLPSNFTAAGSTVYFWADDAAHGSGLWLSDGTRAGTRFVKALPEPAPTEGIDGLQSAPPILTATAVGSRLFFTTEPSRPGTSGSELWVSDGTPAGTTVLANINPNNSGANTDSFGQFAAFDGALIFTNGTPARGVELWRSDGTAGGTRPLQDLDGGRAGSDPGNLAVVDGRLYYSARTATGASALWSSDGTAAGTRVDARLGSQPNGDGLSDTIADAFAVIGNNSMVFAANDGAETELWRTDGTPAGTTRLKVLPLGALGNAPSDFTTVGRRAFFIVDENTAQMLWVTDGTTAGTKPVAPIDGGFSDPVAFDGKLAYLVTTPDGTASSLWLSDGTASGTRRAATFPTIEDSNLPAGTAPMAVLNGKLFIAAPAPTGSQSGGLYTLWVSDGTPAGTKPITAVPGADGIDSLAVYRGRIYFSVDASLGGQVWATDGTPAGTRMVVDLGAGRLLPDLLAAGPNLYIVTADDLFATSSSVYRSDGTARGTVRLDNFARGNPIGETVLPDGRLAFYLINTASNDAPLQLWMSNGTVAGTKAVAGVGGPDQGAGAIAAIGGRFFVQGTDATHGTELWQSNGQATTLVQDINPGPGSSNPYPLAELNGRLIVAADDGRHGLGLLSGPMPRANAAFRRTPPV